MDYFEPADILIYIQGQGVVLKEKSLVAFDTESKKIIAFGEDAARLAKSPPEHVKILSPLRRGMIADYQVAVNLLTHLLRKAWGRKPLRAPGLLTCVPKGMTDVEMKAVEDALIQSGAREIFITDFSLEQILEAMPELPKGWKKVKTYVAITKEEPERYLAEQFSDMFLFAEQEGIPVEKITEMFQDAVKKPVKQTKEEEK